MAFNQTQGFNIQSSEPVDKRYLPPSIAGIDPFVIHSGMEVFVGGKQYIYYGATNTNTPSLWKQGVVKDDLDAIDQRLVTLTGEVSVLADDFDDLNARLQVIETEPEPDPIKISVDKTVILAEANTGDTVAVISVTGITNPVNTLSGANANLFTVNGNLLVLSQKPNQGGTLVVTVTSTGEGRSASQTFNLTVAPPVTVIPGEDSAIFSIGPTPIVGTDSTQNIHSKTEAGASTTIFGESNSQIVTIENIDTMQSNNLGFTTGNNSGVVPDTYLEGYFFVVNAERGFRLKGLNDDSYYKITFYGSRNQENRGTRFRIGNESKVLDVSNNTTRGVTFYNVRSVAGLLPFYFSNGIRDVGYFNAVKIEKSADLFDAPVVPVPDPGIAGEVFKINTALPAGLQRGKFMPPANYEILWNDDIKNRFISLRSSFMRSEETNVIDTSTAGIYKALRYKTTGNVSEGVAALSWMEDHVNAGISTGEINTLGSNEDMWAVGIIHSWCKSLYSRSDTPSRSDMVTKIARLCWDSNFDKSDSPIFPNKSIDDLFGNNTAQGNVRWATTHHVSHICSLFYAATAIADDEPRPYRQLRDNIIDEGVKTKNAINRGSINGPQYGIGRGATNAMIEMLLQDIARANGQTNLRYFPKECFLEGRIGMYLTRPDGVAIKHGDLYHYFPFSSYSYTYWFIANAVAGEDGQVLDFARRVPFNNTDIDDPAQFPVASAMLLLAQKPLARSDYKQAPLSFSTNYPAGVQVDRSGWDIRVKETGSNDWLVANFTHIIVGNHTAHALDYSYYFNGALEAPSGIYRGGAAYGSEHTTNFLQQGASYSTFMSQHWDVDMPVRNSRRINMGGIKFVNNPRNLSDIIEGYGQYVYDSILASRSHTEHGLMTIMQDTSQAEDDEYAKVVRRVFLHVTTGDTTFPFLVFTQDYFENNKNGTTNITLCQSADDLATSNTNKTFQITNNRNPNADLQYNGKSSGWVWGAEVVATWEGWHTARNSSGVPIAPEAPPPEPSSWQAIYTEEGGKRADIRTTGEGTAEHIVLRIPSTISNTPAAPVMSQNGEFRMVQAQGVAILMADGHKTYSSVSFTIPATRRVVILCLSPGDYTDQNGQSYTLKSGFLFDRSLPAGSYTLTRVGEPTADPDPDPEPPAPPTPTTQTLAEYNFNSNDLEPFSTINGVEATTIFPLNLSRLGTIDYSGAGDFTMFLTSDQTTADGAVSSGKKAYFNVSGMKSVSRIQLQSTKAGDSLGARGFVLTVTANGTTTEIARESVPSVRPALTSYAYDVNIVSDDMEIAIHPFSPDSTSNLQIDNIIIKGQV